MIYNKETASLENNAEERKWVVYRGGWHKTVTTEFTAVSSVRFLLSFLFHHLV